MTFITCLCLRQYIFNLFVKINIPTKHTKTQYKYTGSVCLSFNDESILRINTTRYVIVYAREVNAKWL